MENRDEKREVEKIIKACQIEKPAFTFCPWSINSRRRFHAYAWKGLFFFIKNALPITFLCITAGSMDKIYHKLVVYIYKGLI